MGNKFVTQPIWINGLKNPNLWHGCAYPQLPPLGMVPMSYKMAMKLWNSFAHEDIFHITWEVQGCQQQNWTCKMGKKKKHYPADQSWD